MTSGPVITFDEFCYGLTFLQKAVMTGYFNAVDCNDNRLRARPADQWSAILTEEMTRPTP